MAPVLKKNDKVVIDWRGYESIKNYNGMEARVMHLGSRGIEVLVENGDVVQLPVRCLDRKLDD